MVMRGGYKHLVLNQFGHLNPIAYVETSLAYGLKDIFFPTNFTFDLFKLCLNLLK